MTRKNIDGTCRLDQQIIFECLELLVHNKVIS